MLWKHNNVKICVQNRATVNPLRVYCRRPILAAARSAWVCGRSLGGNVGPNGCISCECCVLSGRGLFVGLIRRREESYRVLYGVTITLYTYGEQAEEVRLTEKERTAESNANIKTSDKSRTYPPNPRDNDVVVKRDTLQSDQIVLLLSYESEFEETQQFLVCADDADLCGEHICLNDSEKTNKNCVGSLPC